LPIVPTLKVARNFPRTKVGKIAWLRFIGTRMQGNAFFPAPPLPMPTFLAGVTDLEAAQAATLTRALGTATARDAKLAQAMQQLDQLVAYVETVARQQPQEAEAIVASSGLSLKQFAGPKRAPFKARQLAKSGCVALSVGGMGRGRSYDWQAKADGEHWVDLTRTTYASATVENLVPGTLYAFRYQSLKVRTLSDWSDPFKLLVV
jgi:hypothetical protein